jgi:hypothetical protein
MLTWDLGRAAEVAYHLQHGEHSHVSLPRAGRRAHQDVFAGEQGSVANPALDAIQGLHPRKRRLRPRGKLPNLAQLLLSAEGLGLQGRDVDLLIPLQERTDDQPQLAGQMQRPSSSSSKRNSLGQCLSSTYTRVGDGLSHMPLLCLTTIINHASPANI